MVVWKVQIKDFRSLKEEDQKMPRRPNASSQPLSAPEKKTLIKLLSKLDVTKPYGTEIFHALCRVGWMVAIEAVAMRVWPGGEVQVYLRRRGKNEVYPGEYHAPGTIVCISDSLETKKEGISVERAVLERLAKHEFKVKPSALKSMTFVRNFFNPDDERGSLLSVICLVEIGGLKNGRNGRWFPMRSLPRNLNRWHASHILPIAEEAFRRENRLGEVSSKKGHPRYRPVLAPEDIGRFAFLMPTTGVSRMVYFEPRE